MATKIVTKNSSTSGSAPSTSDLVQGELAVNVVDKRLYTENNSGAIVELGTNPAGAVTMASTLAVAGVLTGASLDISGDIDVDGTTNLDVVDIDGAVDMASTLAVAGVVTANAGVVVDNFTLDGTTLALSSGDMLVDVAGNITLDADDNGEIRLKDGGTQYGALKIDSSRFKIQSIISDADMLFAVNDGGSEVTALALDASAAGAATFNSSLTIPDYVIHAGNTSTKLGFGSANTLNFISNGSDRLTIANSFAVFNEAGTDYNFRVESLNNANMLFVDGGADNVGIGTAAPSLAGFGGSVNGLEIADSAQAGIRLNGDAADDFYLVSGASKHWLYGKGNVPMSFSTNTVERFVIAADGSLSTPTAGTQNLRLGANAGNSIALGANYNTLIGDGAGTDFTTGCVQNVALGVDALANDVKGCNSVAIGAYALNAQSFSSTTGAFNTAVGNEAGLRVTTGIRNTLLGSFAGDAIQNASENEAVGYSALSANVLGSGSVAVGSFALNLQNPASAVTMYNVAVGNGAGAAITTGTTNSFLGGLCGDGTNDGTANTAMGYSALSANCGDGNTAIGASAGAIVTGDFNTLIGEAAGNAVSSGGNNLLLGTSAGRTGSPGGNITSHSNRICLGDSSISEANIKVDWTVSSDARDKTDFTALDLGLDFVKALAPVTYKWDERSKYIDKTDVTTYDDNGNVDHEGWEITTDLNAITHDGTHKEDWLDIGFKAQEVEALEIAAGYNKSNKTNLVSSHTGDGKQMGLKYSKFVPILVKAIQEQNALIEALTARIETLEG